MQKQESCQLSHDEDIKEASREKRFYIILHAFLNRNQEMYLPASHW